MDIRIQDGIKEPFVEVNGETGRDYDGNPENIALAYLRVKKELKEVGDADNRQKSS